MCEAVLVGNLILRVQGSDDIFSLRAALKTVFITHEARHSSITIAFKILSAFCYTLVDILSNVAVSCIFFGLQIVFFDPCRNNLQGSHSAAKAASIAVSFQCSTFISFVYLLNSPIFQQLCDLEIQVFCS